MVQDRPVACKLQIDRKGTGQVEDSQRIEVNEYAYHIFPEDLEAQWVRVHPDQDCNATVSIQFSDEVYRKVSDAAELFNAIAGIEDKQVRSTLLFPAKRNRNLRVIHGDTPFDFSQFDFEFQPTEPDASLGKKLAVYPAVSKWISNGRLVSWSIARSPHFTATPAKCVTAPAAKR